jgi:hypothetical protein
MRQRPGGRDEVAEVSMSAEAAFTPVEVAFTLVEAFMSAEVASTPAGAFMWVDSAPRAVFMGLPADRRSVADVPGRLPSAAAL